MKRSWDLKPNLLDCILEERIAPAITNLGVIVLTTSGLSLVTPFPGASNNASGAGGTQTTAASVSGAAMPTSFYITGSRGISSFTPGNFTGNPAVGGAVATAGGPGGTIQVGSGADDAKCAGDAHGLVAEQSRVQRRHVARHGLYRPGLGDLRLVGRPRKPGGSNDADGPGAVAGADGGGDPRLAVRHDGQRDQSHGPAVRCPAIHVGPHREVGAHAARRPGCPD